MANVTLVRLPNGCWKTETFPRWIDHRLYLVEHIAADVSTASDETCRVKMWLSDGRLFIHDWETREAAWEWLTTRKGLKECPVLWYGKETTLTGSGKLEQP